MKKNGTMMPCEKCGKDFYIVPSVYKKGRRLCSSECRRPLAFIEVKSGNIICRSCKSEKLESEFYRCSSMKDGHHVVCKLCSHKTRKEWGHENIEKIKAWNRTPESLKRTREYARKKTIEDPFRSRWASLAKRAVSRGFGIMDKPSFFLWFRSQKTKCVYCGINQEVAKIIFRRNLCIDRKDNSKGYIDGNLVLACWRCNCIKSAYLSFDEMMVVASMFIKPKMGAPV